MPQDLEGEEFEVVAIRGPDGLLGLDIVANKVVHIVPGSASDIQGIIAVGDQIVAVDGQRITRDVEVRKVMLPGNLSYNFLLFRPVAAEHPASTGQEPEVDAPAPAFKLNLDDINRKNSRLSRASGQIAAPLDPTEASEKQLESKNAVAATPRTLGRSESEVGFCV